MSRTVFTSLIGLGVVFVTLNGAPGYAALGDCSQPVSDGPTPVSSDCLFILKTATGSEICEPECARLLEKIRRPNRDIGVPVRDHDDHACPRRLPRQRRLRNRGILQQGSGPVSRPRRLRPPAASVPDR